MIYTASKVVHAGKWRKLRADGYPIISTWIDEAGAGGTVDFTDLWSRCASEAAMASSLLLYREQGETLKGAFIEAGIALASGKPVLAIGCEEFSFVNHPLVRQFADLPSALHEARILSSIIPATKGGEVVEALQKDADWLDSYGRDLVEEGDADLEMTGSRLERIAGRIRAALAQDTDATPPVAPTGTVGSQTEALRAFAESFHFTVTDSFYKDAYLGIHEPDSVTIRLVNNSLESAHIAKLEARRKAALSAPTVEEKRS